jgi:deferrochelatase/peroxidase EfeB
MGATRRGFLTAAGLAGLGAGVGVLGERAVEGGSAVGEPGGRAAVPFFGAHQAGIATPTQQHLQFGAFDLVSGSVEDLRSLLQQWSAAAALLAEGRPVGALETGEAAPVDTGEALGLGPAALTVTFGLGPRVFGRDGRDRLGLAGRRPAPLIELPAFAGDALDPSVSGGDLCVQVCSDDPQVAFHALHNLVRIAAPVAFPRWVLGGFGRTSNSRAQVTPRNLMGFKDGTNNIVVEDRQALGHFVWAGARESPAWMAGGSYMVVRRIKMLLGAWDATGLSHQEATFGRYKLSGAPLTGLHERDPVELAVRSGGVPVIPADAHVRLASAAYNGEQRILRRGYSFVDGVDEATGSASGGLMFICFQRDPRRQFIPIQRRLAGTDALNRHIEHVGSAIFACPPGARRGGFVGQGLFE